MTRPKYNAERAILILQEVRSGVPQKTAAALAGISETTLYRWLEQGEEEPAGEFGFFLVEFRAAQAYVEQEAIVVWRQAFMGGLQEVKVEERPDGVKITTTTTRIDWRAAEAFLKRRFGASWGDRAVLEHEGEVHVKVIEIVDAQGNPVDLTNGGRDVRQVPQAPDQPGAPRAPV